MNDIIIWNQTGAEGEEKQGIDFSFSGRRPVKPPKSASIEATMERGVVTWLEIGGCEEQLVELYSAVTYRLAQTLGISVNDLAESAKSLDRAERQLRRHKKNIKKMFRK